MSEAKKRIIGLAAVFALIFSGCSEEGFTNPSDSGAPSAVSDAGEAAAAQPDPAENADHTEDEAEAEEETDAPEPEQIAEPEPEPEKTPFQLYADYLSEHLSDSDLSCFDLLYLDDDEIPELMTGGLTSEDQYTVSFYTIREGSVTPAGSIQLVFDNTNDELCEIPRSGLLRLVKRDGRAFSQPSVVTTEYYRFENGSVKAAGNTLLATIDQEYTVNGEPVEKDVYRQFGEEHFPYIPLDISLPFLPYDSRNHPLAAGYCVSLVNGWENEDGTVSVHSEGMKNEGQSGTEIESLLENSVSYPYTPMSVELQKAYVQKLSSRSVQYNSFGFFHVDSDSIPEMAVYNPNGEISLFMYIDGKVQQFGRFSMPYISYIPEGGRVHAYNDGGDEYSYRMKDGEWDWELEDAVTRRAELNEDGTLSFRYYRLAEKAHMEYEPTEITEEEYRSLYDALVKEREEGGYVPLSFPERYAAPVTWKMMFENYSPDWVNLGWEQLYLDYLNSGYAPGTETGETTRYALIHLDEDDVPELLLIRRSENYLHETFYSASVYRIEKRGDGDLAYSTVQWCGGVVSLPFTDEFIYKPYQSTMIDNWNRNLSYYDASVNERRSATFNCFAFRSFPIDRTWEGKMTGIMLGAYEEGERYIYSVDGEKTYLDVPYGAEGYQKLMLLLKDSAFSESNTIKYETAYSFDGTLKPAEAEKVPGKKTASDEPWVQIYKNQLEYEYAMYRDFDPRFTLIHLDEDEIPELVVSSRQDHYSASGKMVINYSVYTCKDDKIETVASASGSLDYIAGTGFYRKRDEYSAFGPNMFQYCKTNADVGYYGAIGYFTGEDTQLWAVGFPDYFGEEQTGGYNTHPLTEEDREELLKRYWPVTATEAKGEGETRGAACSVETEYEINAENMGNLVSLVPEFFE